MQWCSSSVCGSTALRPRPRPPVGDSSAGCDDWRRTGRKPHPGWSPRHTHASIHHCRGDMKGPDANVTHASFPHHRTITQTTYLHLLPQRVSKRLPRPQRASVTTFGFLLFTLLYFQHESHETLIKSASGSISISPIKAR